MMSNNFIYKLNEDDENYTLPYGVIPLLKYMNKNLIYWCPFSTAESEFVKVLKSHGFNVVYSHISTGQDFFLYEPKEWDVIIDNPPFRGKRKIFERALSFNKPFCLLMTLAWLNDSAPKDLFMNKKLELLMFRERMKFNGKNIGKINFSSAYFGHNFFPKQIIMESLKKHE